MSLMLERRMAMPQGPRVAMALQVVGLATTSLAQPVRPEMLAVPASITRRRTGLAAAAVPAGQAPPQLPLHPASAELARHLR